MMRVVETDVLERPGTGVPLVLLHGIGSNAHSWQPAMDALEPGIRALAWNAPGYGGSARLAVMRPTPADYAARLHAVLDALGTARAVLVGHSLGCLFAARFAAAYPARVVSLVLLSPAQGYGVAAGGDLPDRVQARIDQLRQMGADAYAAARAGHLMHRPDGRPDILARLRAGLASLDLAGYAQAVHALGSGDLIADAPRITVPVSVAYGAEDGVTSPSGAERLMAALPAGANLTLVPETGHALPQEQPRWVAALLSELHATHAHG